MKYEIANNSLNEDAPSINTSLTDSELSKYEKKCPIIEHVVTNPIDTLVMKPMSINSAGGAGGSSAGPAGTLDIMDRCCNVLSLLIMDMIHV